MQSSVNPECKELPVNLPTGRGETSTKTVIPVDVLAVVNAQDLDLPDLAYSNVVDTLQRSDDVQRFTINSIHEASKQEMNDRDKRRTISLSILVGRVIQAANDREAAEASLKTTTQVFYQPRIF